MVHVINTAIVEDEAACSEQLKNYLQRYAKENDLEITTEVYPNGDEFLSASRSYDVIFMDIEMPGSDGLSVVKRLRETDGDVTVFFVTGLAQYAVNGYEVRAFDFMVKPVGYYDFAIKFSRAVESLSAKRKCEIWVKSRQGKKLVTADKLMYVEVMRHNLVFHTTEGDVGGTGTLKSVTEVIDTYVYQKKIDGAASVGPATAAGLFQSVCSFVLVLATNAIVRKIDPERSLF